MYFKVFSVLTPNKGKVKGKCYFPGILFFRSCKSRMDGKDPTSYVALRKYKHNL